MNHVQEWHRYTYLEFLDIWKFPEWLGVFHGCNGKIFENTVILP